MKCRTEQNRTEQTVLRKHNQALNHENILELDRLRLG